MINNTDMKWYALVKSFILKYGLYADKDGNMQQFPAKDIVQLQQDFNSLNGKNEFIGLRMGELRQIPIIPLNETLYDDKQDVYISKTEIPCLITIQVDCYGANAIGAGWSMWTNIENYGALAWIRHNFGVSYHSKTNFVNITNKIDDQVLYATRKRATLTFSATQTSMFKLDSIEPKYDGYFVI